MKHKFEIGQTVWARSGKRYTIEHLRSDDHPKLNGEPGYYVVGERDGKRYGPVRIMRESAFRTGEE